MATLNQLVVKWINRDTGHRPREIGRFYATDIYKIRKGYLTPQNFFEKKEIKDDTAIELVTRGIAMEDLMLKILTEMNAKVEHHKKFELKVTSDIIISGEMDFLFPDKVFECKYPKGVCYEIPERYIDQMTCYHVFTGLPVHLCEFPFPARVWKLEPDLYRWKENIEILIKFNEKLKKIKK